MFKLHCATSSFNDLRLRWSVGRLMSGASRPICWTLFTPRDFSSLVFLCTRYIMISFKARMVNATRPTHCDCLFILSPYTLVVGSSVVAFVHDSLTSYVLRSTNQHRRSRFATLASNFFALACFQSAGLQLTSVSATVILSHTACTVRIRIHR